MSHSPAKKLGICSSDFSQSDGAGASVLICQNTVLTPLDNGDTYLKKKKLLQFTLGYMQIVSLVIKLPHSRFCASLKFFIWVFLDGFYFALS